MNACDVCGGPVSGIDYRLSVFGMLNFCSCRCFLDHVRGMEPIDLVQFTRIGCAITENNFLSSNGHAFSRIFKKSFRSLYEVHFAETAVLIWKEEVLYEPHIIRLRMRGSGFSHYVPDFYFPAYGVWVETKGVWSIGGKRKFVHAMKMIGRDRLLLLPSSQGNVWCADRGKW